MSSQEDALATPVGPARRAHVARELAYRWPVYTACSALALLFTVLLGKDVPWDTLHYHLYAGFSALHDRFGQDYFAAGPESYDNPYAYVPFYLLVAAGLSSLRVACILALVQSAILWLTYELALDVCPSHDRRTRVVFGLCAVALALANPILIQQFGSSFADITTAELALGGWLLLAKSVRTPRLVLIIWAGIFLGAATALKPTNAVHALAAFAVLALMPLTAGGLIRFGLGYGVSLGAGFVVVSAPWSYQLERMFGNPVFPLLNGIFRSPDFTTAPLLLHRFIPESFMDAVLRPFAIAKPNFMIQEELRAPDLRYAVLAMLAVVFLLCWLWRRFRLPPGTRAPTGAPSITGTDASAGRVLAALACGFAVDWAMWLTASGNGRYFLPMACVAGVIVVGLLFRICLGYPKVRNYALIGLFMAQALQLVMGTEYRWNGGPWTSQWLDVSVPKPLATEPDLYLTIGVQSNAFIAPYLDHRSGLINYAGDYVLGTSGANAAHVEALIHRYSPNLRMLVRGDRLYDDASKLAPRRSAIDNDLLPVGLRVDTGNCATITVRGLPPDLQITLGSGDAKRGASDTTDLLSCGLVVAAVTRSSETTSQRDADIVLDRLEDACPLLFQPRRSNSKSFGKGWLRRYLNTDLVAWVSRGWVKFEDPIRGGGVVFVGSESDWLKAAPRIVCGRKDERYFARIVPSSMGSERYAKNMAVGDLPPAHAAQ